MKSNSVTIQKKASAQHFPVVPFITLYSVVLTFKSVDEISKYDSKKDPEQYCTVTLFAVYTLCEVVPTESVDKSKVGQFKSVNASEQYFPMVCVLLTFYW